MDVRSVLLSEPEEVCYSVCVSLQVCIGRFENGASPATLKVNQLMNVERGRKKNLLCMEKQAFLTSAA